MVLQLNYLVFTNITICLLKMIIQIDFRLFEFFMIDNIIILYLLIRKL